MAHRIEALRNAPQLAYKALRLVDPADRDTYDDIVLELGTFCIIENEVAVRAVVDTYIGELATHSRQMFHELARKFPSTVGTATEFRMRGQHRELIGALSRRAVLTFDDFLKYVGHERAEANNDDVKFSDYQHGAEQIRNQARYKFARLQHHTGFPATFASYQTYLRATNKKLYDALAQELPALFPEEPRRTHTYITATTKTGKTELIKALCLNYIQQRDYAGVVVLDPGGDMAPQMAKWVDLVPTGQLVYIDPALSRFNSPVINPFDAEHLNEQDRKLLTEQIVIAIRALVADKAGGAVTVNMEAVLYPCVRLLVDLPNTSLLDLIALMKDDPQLIEAGCQSADPLVADFFRTEFTKLPNLKLSKQSINVKLRNILGKGILDKVLCGRTSIDLERLMNERRFIVVNLGKGQLGETESQAFGTLLVSLIQAIAMKRERLTEHERPMTHLIIDECHNFVTTGLKDIIRETRKFGLAVTLAQQEVGGDMPPDLESVVLKTTNVKVAGRSSPTETKRSSVLVGVSASDLDRLELGQFYWKNGTAPPVLLHVRRDRLGFKKAVTVPEYVWDDVRKQQQRLYYRRQDGQPASTKVSPSSSTKRKYTFE